MRHLDLFSGIGGFALAADRVWGNVEHTLCDNDLFCQEVLKKHWPTAKIYGDIRELIRQLECGNVITWTNKNETEDIGGTITTGIEISDSPTIKSTKRKKETKTDSLSLKHTENVAPVAEKQPINSLPSTIKTITGTKKENATESVAHIKIASKEGSQKTINSSVGTATLQKEYTENAHTKIDILSSMRCV